MDYVNRGYWNAVMSASLCKFLILRVISERPRHGYGIVWRVAELTKHLCAPTQGAVYPALRDFEKAGCVASRIERRGRRERKVYRLTARGREALQAAAEVWHHGLQRLRTIVRPAVTSRMKVGP
ncbi:MAG TPA: PadR family transcriptional regulator [Kiritimatiellia bacterium]|nr:PadR family transcriptional regulator [Kiritimatiellia bacterium]HRZ10943.1 PadR family transcriptional regulator [Kiritimatiellia bacterium]HSA18516.1 PadR family transcriptional regulator [Kiritimatiellia bacterium]